jgi:hypothetical protein
MQQAYDIQNSKNSYIRNIGQREDRHGKYKRIKEVKYMTVKLDIYRDNSG